MGVIRSNIPTFSQNDPSLYIDFPVTPYMIGGLGPVTSRIADGTTSTVAGS